MATIKKLVLRGFKSFAKRLEIPFENNFSCFLGANGSGKSNVVDAICFVLGTTSAKTLRAEKSANLIFNGGKKDKPLKEAEVSIVFCNSKKDFPIDSKEVMISRLVKSSGQSVYKINNETRTRQQMVDLLSHAKINPDGHNIVLQGDIVHFTEMRSTERRELIEDIAGISVYEEKKAKAMNELEKVQNKLNEADIILTERQKTLSELKKDRDQAVTYKEKEELLKRSKATKFNLLIKDKNLKIEESKSHLEKITSEIDSIQKEIDSLKNERQEKEKEIKKINEEMNNKGDLKQVEITKEVDDLKGAVIKNSTRKDVCENELRKLDERKKQLEKEEKEIETKISNWTKKKDSMLSSNIKLIEKEAEILKSIKEWKEKHGLKDADELNRKIEELDKKLEENQTELYELNNKKQELIRNLDKKSYELKSVETEEEKFKEIKADHTEKIERLKFAKNEFKNIARKLADALNENSVFASQLGSTRNKYHDTNDELSKLRMRSIGIKDLTASDNALKKLKSMNISGLHGSVSELGNVSSKYAMALQIAAGSRLKSVVVNNDSTASKCIQILKDSKTGFLTFLPLNKLKERIVEDETMKLKGLPGVHGLAIDFISHDSKFKSVFKYVFGPTLVVEDLTIARKIGIGRSRMVTLEGDLVETSGAMIGGFRTKTNIGFQEKEVNESISRIEKEVNVLLEKIDMLENKKTENDEFIIKFRENKAKLEAEIEAIEKITGKGIEFSTRSKSELSKEIAQLQQDLEIVEKDIKVKYGEITSINTSRQGLRTKIAEATGSNLSSELEKKDNNLKETKDELLRDQAEIKGLDAQISVHAAELKRINSIMGNSNKEKINFTQELEILKKEEVEKKARLKELLQTQKKFYAEYQGMFKKRDKLKNHISQVDMKIIKKEERARHNLEKSNDWSVRIAEIVGELAGLNREQEE
ncbi:MAG: AAA family ATPase, partial [Nanoarchaeota archaeon]|nr:AAA family ATPase [Nanoarchaeota archaeon]